MQACPDGLSDVALAKSEALAKFEALAKVGKTKAPKRNYNPSHEFLGL